MKTLEKLNSKEVSKLASNIKKDKDFNGMNEADFNNLVASIKEAQTIIAKMKKVKTEKTDSIQPAKIRKELKLSQEEFATFIGVKTSTLRNWEQGRVKIPSVAKTLLKIVKSHPEVVVA